jgi:hypothetical protein
MLSEGEVTRVRARVRFGHALLIDLIASGVSARRGACLGQTAKRRARMSITTDRARKHTAAAVLRRIDGDTEATLARHAENPEAIDTRLAELDAEWDLDRAIETEASVVALTGLALGAFLRRELLVIPLLVGTGVLLYASTGRYPLGPVFRRLGLRTSREIGRERYALKALRGDFAGMADDSREAEAATHAASRSTGGERARALDAVGNDQRT